MADSSPSMAAAICAAVFASSFGSPIFGNHISVNTPARFGPLDQNPVLIGLMGLAAQVFLVSFITCFVYLLDCLYSERKDRSILFWKSLPVSDTQTVLAKVAVAALVVPLGTILLIFLTQPIIWLITWVRFESVRPYISFDLLAAWAPSEAVRRRILAENPEVLYGFAKAA